jgi:hypothetical protein
MEFLLLRVSPPIYVEMEAMSSRYLFDGLEKRVRDEALPGGGDYRRLNNKTSGRLDNHVQPKPHRHGALVDGRRMGESATKGWLCHLGRATISATGE